MQVKEQIFGFLRKTSAGYIAQYMPRLILGTKEQEKKRLRLTFKMGPLDTAFGIAEP